MKLPGLQKPPVDLKFLYAWMETLEILTGRRAGRIVHAQHISGSPSMADYNTLVDKINEIVDRLQGD